MILDPQKGSEMLPEINAIQATLKIILKNKGMTYKDLGHRLSVSEVTVKRLMTSDSLSLAKLCEICAALDLSLFDLMNVARPEHETRYTLSLEQEEYFANHFDVYQAFIFLVQHKNIEKLKTHFNISDSLMHKYIRQLERMNLIKIGPQQRVEAVFKGVLTWLRKGPLQKLMMRKRHYAYIEAYEEKAGEECNDAYLSSAQRLLSPESFAGMKQELRYVVQKYARIAFQEETIFPKESLLSTSWLIGLGLYEEDVKVFFENPTL